MNEIINDEIRKRIRVRIAELNINSHKVAIAAGVNKSFLSDYLRGSKKRIDAADFPAIARALDCDAEYLLAVQDTPRR